MKVYAIIPARAGSKGFKNKNVHIIGDKPLMAYSIEFAKKLDCDKIICSTDSKEYADIAVKYGAEVPFLRSSFASSDTAMEDDILKDLYEKFIEFNIDIPDVLVWLRPTFVFRDTNIINECIDILKKEPEVDSVRTVCEAESRLYSLKGERNLEPAFDDKGRSMIRRQEVGKKYKVYSADVFRFGKDNLNNHFLGKNVVGIEINKICGLDIDDEVDMQIVKCLIESKSDLIKEYI